MSRSIASLALCLLVASLLLPNVRGQNASSGSDTNVPVLVPAPLVIDVERSTLGDIDNGLHVSVVEGTNSFGFQVPAGYTLHPESGKGTMIVEPPDRSGSIVISCLKYSASNPKELDSDLLRPVILLAHPGATILGESTAMCFDANALSFDLDVTASGAQWFCQIIAAPTPDGCVLITSYGSKESKGEIWTIATRIRASMRKAGLDGRIKFPKPASVL